MKIKVVNISFKEANGTNSTTIPPRKDQIIHTEVITPSNTFPQMSTLQIWYTEDE